MRRDGKVRAGVLALQGDFAEHCAMLRQCGTEPLEVRTIRQLDQVDGLIIPGGESTTIARLLIAFGMRERIIELGRGGLPIWGTCAGAILLATEIETLDRPALHLMPMAVERNAWGRQVDSFEADLDAPDLAGGSLRAIFIRAPRIKSVGEGVEVLLELSDGEPVAAACGALTATTFHPELTGDRRMHERFAAQCLTYAESRNVEEGAIDA